MNNRSLRHLIDYLKTIPDGELEEKFKELWPSRYYSEYKGIRVPMNKEYARRNLRSQIVLIRIHRLILKGYLK